MTDNINPSHYKDGPFECIELSSLLSFDWGNVIKYCYRWRDKNGVEDLKKALWYAKHAIDNNVPFLAMYLGPDNDIITARPIRLLGILEAENWADLEPFWNEIKWGCYKKAVKVLADKINEIERMVSDEPGPGNHRRDHLHDDYLHRVHRIASRFQRENRRGLPDGNRQDR